MALVAYGSSGSSGEESGGEESRETLPTREKDQKSILAVVGPSIGSGKKGKGNVVKIGLPTLVRQVRLGQLQAILLVTYVVCVCVCVCARASLSVLSIVWLFSWV